MLPQRLKALRKEAGLTQKEIAQQIQVGQNSYSNWENGNRKPTAEITSKLAHLFNVSTEYLLGKTDNKNPEDELSDVEILYRRNSKNMTPEQKEIFKKELLEFMEIRRKAFEEEEQ